MSAAKMVADSTVPTELLGDRRKRRKSSESRRNKRAKKSSNKGHKHDHSSDDSDSDLDLSKDLKEIGDYIKDRQEMLEQMFHAVRGPSLKRALPEILLELPLDDLKKRCLEQLEIMSRKRIRRILEGDNPADISSSGTEESSAEDSQAPQGVGTGEEEEVEYIEIEEEVEVTASEGDEEAVSDKEERGPDSEEGEAKSEGTAEADDGSLEETIVEDEEDNPEEQVGGSEDEPANEEEEEEREASETGPSQTATRSAVLTKDQMEILELEMRARAIKAMLNKQAKLVEATEMAAAEPNSTGSLSGNESEKEVKDEDSSPTRSESVPEIGQGDKEDVLSDGELPNEETPNDDLVTEASFVDDQQQCDQGNSSAERKNESHEKEPESLEACTKGIPDPTKIVKRKLSSKKKAAIKAREEGKMLFSSTEKKSEPSAKIDEEDTTCQKDTEVSTTSVVETTQNTVDANADSREGTSKISSHCTEENTAGIVDMKPKLDGIDNENTDSTERESINTGVITNVVTETRNMEKGSQISKSEEMKSDGPDSEDKQHFAKMEENMNIESKTWVQETSEHLLAGADGSPLVQEERSESIGQVCTGGEEIKAEEESGSITDEKLVHRQDECYVNSDQSVLKKTRSSPERSTQIIEDVDSVSEILEFVVNSVVSSMDVQSKKETIESPIQTVETPGKKNESCVGKADSSDPFESRNLQKEPLTKGTVDVEKVRVVEVVVLQDKSSLGQRIATENETLEEKKETVIEKAETVSNEKRSDADRAELVDPKVVSDASSSGATVLLGSDDVGGSVPENINVKSAVEAEQVEEPDSTCSVTEESEKPVQSSFIEETKPEVEEEEHEEGEVISEEEECSGT